MQCTSYGKSTRVQFWLDAKQVGVLGNYTSNSFLQIFATGQQKKLKNKK
jgi:hypothetical protein